MSQDDLYGPGTGPVHSPAPPHGAGGYEQAGWQPEFAQPEYAQRGYPQQGYPAAGSPPPGYGYGYGPGPQRTNVMAILGLVFAFVFSPLGIVFSAIGLSQVKKRGEKGRGLALTGLILSIVLLVLGVLVVAAGLSSPAVRTALDSARASASSAAAASSDAASDAGSGSQGATDEGAAAGGAGDATGVVAACQTIVPALMNLEADLQDVKTPEQYRQALTALESTLSSAADGASDAQFPQDVAQLNADLEKAATVVQDGGDTTSLEKALNADGEAVGQACMDAGFTN